MHNAPRLLVLLTTAAVGCLSTATSVPAQSQPQTFTIYGKVTKQGSGFALADLDIPLEGGSNVGSFLGKVAQIRGTNTGTTAKPVIRVSSIQESSDEFQIGGDSRIGRELRLRLESERGNTYYIFLSLRRGFIPTDNLFPNLNLRGTFFLDVNSFVLFGPGRLEGHWDEKVPVPNATALIGLEVWAQGAVGFPDKSAAYLNAERVVLKSAGG
jgi:hypothetical protein